VIEQRKAKMASKTFTREQLNINPEAKTPADWDQFYSVDDEIIGRISGYPNVVKINTTRTIGEDEAGIAYTETIVSIEVVEATTLEELQSDIQKALRFDIPNIILPKAEMPVERKAGVSPIVALKSLQAMKPQPVREVETALTIIITNMEGGQYNDGFIDRNQFSIAMRKAFDLKPEVHPLVKSALELGEKQFKDWHSADCVTYFDAGKRDEMQSIIRNLATSF
jgi:hypothetical protein